METADTTAPLAAHLPAIYQGDPDDVHPGDAPGDMSSVLLAAFEGVLRPIDATLDALEWYLDPATTPSPATPFGGPAATAHGHGDEDFLSWLAAWVDAEVSDVETSRSDGDRALHLDSKRRHLVANAARLYTERGTAAGLKKLLAAVFDVSVEVHEWQYPQGMRIGVSSNIGVDTVLMPRVDVRRSFVVVWRPQLDPGAQEQLERSTRWVATIGEDGATRGRIRTSMLVAHDEPGWAASAQFRTIAERIGRAVQRERPAHTQAYVGLEWEDAAPPAPAMIIGVTSTIGRCRLADKVDDGL